MWQCECCGLFFSFYPYKPINGGDRFLACSAPCYEELNFMEEDKKQKRLEKAFGADDGNCSTGTLYNELSYFPWAEVSLCVHKDAVLPNHQGHGQFAFLEYSPAIALGFVGEENSKVENGYYLLHNEDIRSLLDKKLDEIMEELPNHSWQEGVGDSVVELATVRRILGDILK